MGFPPKSGLFTIVASSGNSGTQDGTCSVSGGTSSTSATLTSGTYTVWTGTFSGTASNNAQAKPGFIFNNDTTSANYFFGNWLVDNGGPGLGGDTFPGQSHVPISFEGGSAHGMAANSTFTCNLRIVVYLGFTAWSITTTYTSGTQGAATYSSFGGYAAAATTIKFTSAQNITATGSFTGFTI